MVETKRTCSYCGLEKCRCRYIVGRAGTSSVTAENVSAQTTLAEMREELELFLNAYPPDTPTAWKFSFTRLDPKKIGKYKPRTR